MLRGKLTQIILFVKDMKKAVNFYHNLIGLDLVNPEDPQKDYSDEMWVELDAGEFTLALHGGASEHVEKTHSLIFSVSDLEAARQEILNSGIKIGEIRILEDGSSIAEGVDSNGHRFGIR